MITPISREVLAMCVRVGLRKGMDLSHELIEKGELLEEECTERKVRDLQDEEIFKMIEQFFLFDEENLTL